MVTRGSYNDKRKIVYSQFLSDTSTLNTGAGIYYFTIPEEFNELKLLKAEAFNNTESSSGNVSLMIRNTTIGADMLTTGITIEQSEYSSYTATVPSVVDPTNNTVSTGDRLAVDCYANGTGTKGVGIILTFE